MTTPSASKTSPMGRSTRRNSIGIGPPCLYRLGSLVERQERFRNQKSDGLTHYPGFSLEAAQLLVQAREVVGLGIDTMSVDIGATPDYPVHLFTSKLGIYHLENVANLTSVPATGSTIVVAPIKLENGSGGPARLFALLD